MEHADYSVRMYDESGNECGIKKRKDIDKRKDIVCCVEVFILMKNRQVVLSRKLNKPKELYPGKLTAPTATILRDGESGMEAAKRTLLDELYIENLEPVYLGKEFVILDIGVKKWLECYYVIYDNSITLFNKERLGNIEIKERDEVEKLVNESNDVAEMFSIVWKRYKEQIPI